MKDKHRNVVRDKWLSQVIHRDVYKIVADNDLTEKSLDLAITGLNLLKALQSKPVFLYSKVNTTSLTAVTFLEEQSFHLIETNIIFEKSIAHQHDFTGNCSLRFAVSDDKNPVAEIARNNFTYSRFHMDNNISNDLANKIKKEWATNYFTGKRGNNMVVALSGELVVGFLLLVYQDDLLIIDLIATKEDHRRKGFARDMIAYAESKCQGFNRILVGTQLANMSSIRFYSDIGFRIASAQYTFHYHNKSSC